MQHGLAVLPIHQHEHGYGCLITTNLRLNGLIDIGGRSVYFGSSDSNVYAVDTESGELVWDQPFRTGARVPSSPAVADDTVYLGSADATVYALE